jgi:hypothetical protein
MQFTADQVWGCAIAADRINGGYLKEPVYARNLDVIEKQANKQMVKDWLRSNSFGLVTAADIERGREVRNYFNGFLLKEIAGKINDFERQALKIAQKDEFTGRDMFDFAVVSCLPAAMLRDQAKNQLTTEIRFSTQLAAAVGDRIQGDIEVSKCYWNQNYGKWRITARMGESFVDFWFGQELKGELRIKGKIKAQRGNKTTQLNYVKIIG